MTNEEAANRLFENWYISTNGNLCADEEEKDAFCEAIGVAVKALRVQQAPAELNRSTWGMRSSCRANRFLGNTFCSRCGRPLTEEAWAEPERRINGGTTDN